MFFNDLYFVTEVSLEESASVQLQYLLNVIREGLLPETITSLSMKV